MPLLIFIVLICLAGCKDLQPTAVPIKSDITVNALNTLYVCRYLLRLQDRNEVVTTQERLDSMEAYIREGEFCSDFAFPYIDFTKYSLLNHYIATDGRVDSIRIRLDMDTVNNSYVCRTTQYFKAAGEPFSPAGNYNSKLLLYPLFKTGYSFSFEEDTVFKR